MTAERIRSIICKTINQLVESKGCYYDKDFEVEIDAKIEVLNDLLEKIDEEEAKNEKV